MSYVDHADRVRRRAVPRQHVCELAASGGGCARGRPTLRHRGERVQLQPLARFLQHAVETVWVRTVNQTTVAAPTAATRATTMIAPAAAATVTSTRTKAVRPAVP